MAVTFKVEDQVITAAGDLSTVVATGPAVTALINGQTGTIETHATCSLQPAPPPPPPDPEPEQHTYYVTRRIEEFWSVDADSPEEAAEIVRQPFFDRTNVDTTVRVEDSWTATTHRVRHEDIRQ